MVAAILKVRYAVTVAAILNCNTHVVKTGSELIENRDSYAPDTWPDEKCHIIIIIIFIITLPILLLQYVLPRYLVCFFRHPKRVKNLLWSCIYSFVTMEGYSHVLCWHKFCFVPVLFYILAIFDKNKVFFFIKNVCFFTRYTFCKITPYSQVQWINMFDQMNLGALRIE